MSDLYSALAGSLGDEKDYYAKDPFIAGASAISQVAPQNNLQSFLFPLLAGALGGYGQKQAKQAMYEDYGASPLLKSLYDNNRPEDAAFGPLTEDQSHQMPENWTPKQGKSDLLLAALTKQNLQEQAQKQKEALDKLTLEYSPEVVGLKANQAGQIKLAEALAEKQVYGNTPGLEGVPKNLIPDALKERIVQNNKNQSLDFIDSKFEQAKQLNGPKSALTSITGIPTDEGNQLRGLTDSVIFQIDKTLGREINSDVRQRLTSLTPKWYDTDAAIDKKKQDIKDLVSSLTASTPVLDSLGLKSGVNPVGISNVVQNQASNIPPGMKLVRNKLTGETKVVPQ